MLVSREEWNPTIASKDGWMYIIKYRIMREFEGFILFIPGHILIYLMIGQMHIGER